MSGKTRIEWATDQWNPITGCSKVSHGCKHCYAEREWPRLAAPRDKPNIYTGRAFTAVSCHPEKLDIPLRWTKSRRIFVNSMSDLFHEDVPDEFIDQVFAVMASAPHHTFQVLTKRPERMRTYVSDGSLYDRLQRAAYTIRAEWPGRHALHRVPITDPSRFPLRNVWLGVSVEDQATADERIPLLLQTPATVRWISAEPLLGTVDLFHVRNSTSNALSEEVGVVFHGKELDWVVVGGESGPQSRPFDIVWARNIIAQCKAANVACFIKQLGARPGYRGKPPFNDWHDLYSNGERLRDRKGGNPSEWPSDLCVREYPA